jgi:hypothetical protein
MRRVGQGFGREYTPTAHVHAHERHYPPGQDTMTFLKFDTTRCYVHVHRACSQSTHMPTLALQGWSHRRAPPRPADGTDERRVYMPVFATVD